MLAGLHAPPLTPLTADFRPDADRFLKHCRRLLASGCHGLVPFGTTGEGLSLSVAERMALLDALLDGGISADKILPGVGSCALSEVVDLSRYAVNIGCAGVLLLPPFYYTAVSEDGLYRWASVVIERVADSRLRIVLYHIPQMTGIGFSPAFIRRLIKAYPENVIGVKDSSGDQENTFTLLEELPDLQIFVGSEAYLAAALAAGAAGCISALANLNAADLRKLVDSWHQTGTQRIQEAVLQVRQAVEAFPMIPALKAAVAQLTSDPAWARPRPPLSPLDARARQELMLALLNAGFTGG